MNVVNILELLADNPPGSFLKAVDFNGCHFGACDITGESPVWEMHPDTDEWFYVIEGRIEMTLLTENEPTHYTAPAGTAFTVTKGIWHKPAAPDGAKFIHFTPGQSMHSDANDPRI